MPLFRPRPIEFSAYRQDLSSRSVADLFKPSSRLGPSLVHERHRPRSAGVAGVEVIQPETSCPDQFVYLPVEVATPSHASPCWGERVLPPSHTCGWCPAMFGKQQLSARPEHAPSLLKNLHGIFDAAQAPSRQHGVEAAIFERKPFTRPLDDLERESPSGSSLLGHRNQRGRRIHPDDLGDLGSKEGQVQGAADPDLEHAAGRRPADPLAVWHELLGPHGKRKQPRQDMAAVKVQYAHVPCACPRSTAAFALAGKRCISHPD